MFLISKKKKKTSKKNKNTKKQKKLKKKKYKVVIHEKEHTWWTFYKLTKGTGFIADQTNLRINHGLDIYSMLVKHILFSLEKLKSNLKQKFVVKEKKIQEITMF